MPELTFSARKTPSLSSLLHILWLRKWVAFSIWLIVSIPAGILLSIYNLPRTYSSSTVLRFPQVVGAQTNVMRDVAITEGQSIISIFNSYQVLDAAIKKLGLRLRITSAHTFHRDVFKEVQYGENLGAGEYTLSFDRQGKSATLYYRPELGTSAYKIFNGPLREPGHLVIPELDLKFRLEFIQGLKGDKIELEFMTFEDAFRDLRKNLGARPLGGGNFEIKLKDRDPYRVAEILNTLRDQFLDVYYGTSEVQDVGILVQMEKDLELAKSRLEGSQDEVSRYFAAHPELIQQQGPSQNENLAYLESRQQIIALEMKKKRVQQAFAARDVVQETEKTLFWALELLSAMNEAGEPKSNILRNSLGEMNSRLMGLKRTLSPEHPRIKAVEEEMNGVYKDIEEAEVALIRRMELDLVDAQQKLAINTPRGINRPAVKVQLELERLNNNNSNNQSIYDRLSESYNKAKLVTGSEFFKVTVVDPARAALYKPPSSETRMIIAALAVLMLMVLIPGLVLVWGLIFIKIWTKDDIRRLLNLKTLGEIRLNKRKKSKASPAMPLAKVDPMLLVFGEFTSGEDLESFRHVREEIENSFRNREHPGKFCIMITSSRPSEGKSTCASNLAITFARKGKRTLLVDADFRMGRTAKIFNLTVTTGIDSLLDQTDMSATQFWESLPSALQPSLQRDLMLAPRQASRPNASELVSSDRFKEFIRLAREQYDVVIIDTPPIMITPEPLSLAELADGVVFVCRSGATVAAEAREAIEILRERTSKIAVILNGIKNSPFQENRYSKYSYYYQDNTPPKSKAKAGI